MKWIGQHIWSFISRFRNDVYLESVSSGTIASGGNLGLDSNNKIVKADTESGELTITNAGNNRVLTSNGGTELNGEAEMTFGASGGALLQLSSSVSNEPVINLVNQNTDSNPSLIHFSKTATGGNDDKIGVIQFEADNVADELTTFAKILGEISNAVDTDESGRLLLKVAASNGSTSALQQALTATGHGTDNKVDIGLGFGVASVTTVAGDLVVTGVPKVGWHGSDTRIKILPRDFVANDGGRPMMIEDDSIGSNELFLFSFSSFDTFAYVPIPTGYKATHVRIYGSDTGQDFYVYEGDINSKTITDVATGSTSIGTEKTLGTEVTSDTTNYLIVRVTSDGATDEIHGGYVTIATV